MPTKKRTPEQEAQRDFDKELIARLRAIREAKAKLAGKGIKV